MLTCLMVLGSLVGSVLVAPAAYADIASPNLPLGNVQRLREPFTFEQNTLYGGRASSYYTYPMSASGMVSGPHNAAEGIASPNLGGAPLSTVAVDAGGVNGERPERLYAWSWDDAGRSNWPTSSPTPHADYIAVASYDSGETAGRVHFVPTPRVSSGIRSTTQNYWSGGEVFQRTGQLYLSSGECSAINGAFRLAIYDPATGLTRGSARLAPATTEDNIFGSANSTCGGNGYVSSDVAVDALGNAYLMVRGPGDTVWGGGGSALETYLVRVVPGEHGADWRYNVVGVVTTSSGQHTSDYRLRWGMAFLNGQLYFSASDRTVARVNPISLRTQQTFLDTDVPQDLSAAQTAPVIAGTVRNDANGDGSIDGGDQGLAGQTVALYDDAGTLLGTRITDGAGGYSFIIDSTDATFHVRVVQPRIGEVNAVQTYASGGSSGPVNQVEPQCKAGSAAGSSGPCSGQVPMPAVDPSLGEIGEMTQLDELPILTTIHVGTANEVSTADFAVYAPAAGSWGDAAFTSTRDQNGPRLYDRPGDMALRLGATRGSYTGGSNDDSHASDDGVALGGPGAPIGLVGGRTILAAGGSYDVMGALRGRGADKAKLAAWLAGADHATDFRTDAITASGASGSAKAEHDYAGTDDAMARVTVPGRSASGGRLTATWLRAIAVDQASEIHEPDNASGAYQPARGSAATDQHDWVNRGEIEDYRVYLADAVVRVAATSHGGRADADFGYRLTGPISTTAPSAAAGSVRPSQPDEMTYSTNSHAVSTLGQEVSLAADNPPAGWSLAGARVIDTATGGDVAGATVDISTRRVDIAGTALSAGADITVELDYELNPDAEASSWTLEPTKVTADGVEAATATASIVDTSGAPRPGASVSFDAPDGVSVSAVIDRGDGSYVATLTSTQAMLAEVHAQVAVDGSSVELPESPKQVTFAAGPPVVGDGRSSVSIDDGDARVADGVASHVVMVRLVDRFGNPVVGVADRVSASGPEGVSVSGFVAGEVAGVYTAEVASTVSGEHAVVAGFGVGADRLEIGSVTAVFAAGGPSVGRSVWRVEPQMVQRVGAEFTATVELKDAQGNAVAAGHEVDFVVPAGVRVVEDRPWVSDGAGRVVVHLTSTRSGVYEVSAMVGGERIGEPASIEFTAGPPVVGEGGSSLAASPGVVEADGVATHWVELVAVDQFGNRVPGAGVVFSVPDGLLPVGSLAGVTDANGVYRVEVSSSSAGVYEVTARVDGLAVVDGSPARVGFVAGGPSVGRSVWRVEPQMVQRVGAEFTATVELKDAQGNAVAAGHEVDFVVPAGVRVVEDRPWVSDGAGRVVVHLTSTRSGVYEVSAMVGGERIGEPASIEFTAGPPVLGPDGASTLAATAGDRTADGVAAHTLTSTLKDEYGNPVPNIDVSFVLPDDLGVPADAERVVRTGSDGVANLDVISTTAGDYQATATISAGPIENGSPATVRFIAGEVDLQASEFAAAPVGPLSVGHGPESQYAGTVVLRDAHRNPIVGAPVTFSAGSRVTVEPSEGRTDTDGRLTATFSSTVAQSASLNAAVQVGGEKHALPAIERTWTAGPPDTAEDGRTKLEATPGDRFADGIAAHTITATLRDAYGNPVPAAAVTFELPDGGLEAAPGQSSTVTTDASGQAALHVVSRRVGEFPITARVGSAPILRGSPAVVRFVAGGVSAAGSQLVVSPDGPLPVGHGPANIYTATVTTRDETGHPVPDSAVRFEVRDAAGRVVVEPALTLLTVRSGADSVATTELTSAVAGAFTVHAFIDGTPVPGSGVQVKWFSADPAPLPQTGGPGSLVLAVAVGLLGAGWWLLAIARRRRVR